MDSIQSLQTIIVETSAEPLNFWQLFFQLWNNNGGHEQQAKVE